MGNWCQVTYKVPAGAGGTYTIVCMMPLWSWFGNGINPQTYSIQVLNPTNLSNATQIPAFALNYTTTSTITSGSYYGPAGSSYGAPNINGAGGSYPTTPPWVDFYQNWYTVPLSSGNTSYMIQLSMPAGGPSPILSIQDASGTQWAYNYTPGSTTATINFSPTSSGIYTIICAGDVAGAPGSPSPNGPPNAPAAPISYTLSFPGEALGGPTTTTVYPGVDLPGSPLNVTVKVTASGGAFGQRYADPGQHDLRTPNTFQWIDGLQYSEQSWHRYAGRQLFWPRLLAQYGFGAIDVRHSQCPARAARGP